MTLDEAIKERQKVIEVQEKLYEEASTNESKEIIKSATDNDRQIAEWLTELKEAKRLLKLAVEDINYYVDCYEAHCDECCCSQDNHCHWKHEAEVLKLIGEDEE